MWLCDWAGARSESTAAKVVANHGCINVIQLKRELYNKIQKIVKFIVTSHSPQLGCLSHRWNLNQIQRRFIFYGKNKIHIYYIRISLVCLFDSFIWMKKKKKVFASLVSGNGDDDVVWMCVSCEYWVSDSMLCWRRADRCVSYNRICK